MIRRAHAILIAGMEVRDPSAPTPNAEAAIDIVLDDLQTRFADQLAHLRLVGPTQQAVAVAFDKLRDDIVPGDLFLVMFAGHGVEAMGAQRAQGWWLAERERLDDVELASLLLRLPAETDVVVISDCCHGARMFHAGARHARPAPPTNGRLEALSRGFASKLHAKGTVRDSPMVCISAATNLVRIAHLADLARETVAAADRHSYGELDAKFRATHRAGRSFLVDARPAERLTDTVLSREPPPRFNAALVAPRSPRTPPTPAPAAATRR